MQQTTLTVTDLLTSLDSFAWLVILVNILLLIFAGRIVGLVYHVNQDTGEYRRRVLVFRALNLLILAAVLIEQFVPPGAQRGAGLKLIWILAVVYGANLILHITNYYLLARYGRKRVIENQTRYVETYHSRLFQLTAQVLVVVITIIIIVRILGFDSWLEAGGVIGFLGVFLALTQSTWAPDVLGGLIILHSRLMEEGDVIELRGAERIYGRVYKTKPFHTEILNLVNNHRIMIRNAMLREQVVHNLSKFASAKGLRETLRFKIGYDVPAEQVEKMFQLAAERVQQNPDIPVEQNYPFEFGIVDTGDHAIEWIVYFYTKDVDSLPRIRQRVLKVFLETATEFGISLATPMTHQVSASTEISEQV